jgi:3D (Asp-Asp-Asp) domain-containing protein
VTPGTLVLVLTTAYAPSCGATGLTYTQTHPAAHHTVAVDPKVIPLGSILLVDGFEGELVAEDTGAWVRARHIDLYVSSCREARAWGVQQRQARVVHVPVRPFGAPSLQGAPLSLGPVGASVLGGTFERGVVARRRILLEVEAPPACGICRLDPAKGLR